MDTPSQVAPITSAPSDGADQQTGGDGPERAPSPDPGAPGPQLLERIRVARQSADWRAVETLTAAYLEAKPEDREAAQLRARACNHLKDWPAAAAAWSHAAELRPDSWEAPYQLARAQLRAGDVLAALEATGRLSTHAETSEDARLAQGHLLVEIGRFRDARRAYAALAKTNRARLEAELDALGTRERLRDRAVALAALSEPGGRPHAAEVAESVSEDLLRSGMQHERAGKPLDALLDFEAAALLLPEDKLAPRSAERVGRVLLERAQGQVRSGEVSEARRIYDGLLRAAPSNPSVLHALGRLLSSVGEWASAVEAWRLFLEAKPDDPKAAIQHARALESAGRFAEAIATWRALGAAAPGNEEAERGLSRLPRRMLKVGRDAMARRRPLDAWRILSAVPPGAPEREEVVRHLERVGRLLLQDMRAAYKERRFQSVVRDGSAAAEILPDSPEVNKLLARAAMKLRRYPIALEAWKRLSQLGPGPDDAVQMQIARCHVHLRDEKAGQAVLAEILARDPHHADARQLQIDIRERLLLA